VTAGTRVVHHEGTEGRWELALRRPPPGLREHVLVLEGYEERMAQPVIQRHPASAFVPLILNFGPPYRLLDPVDPQRSAEHRSSFVSGLGDSFAITESTGSALCVQVNLTPLGARRFLGVPMDELANRVVPLADVLGPEVDRLEEQLFDAQDWESRLTCVESLLTARLRDAPPPRPDVAWAWRRLEETGGRIRIGALAAELRCSRKHLVTQFRAHVGVPPKAVARILRFDRLVRLLSRQPHAGWAELAQACGYYDQAHLSRDVRQLAGCTPGELARERQFTFVQDGAAPRS
jgi:AraC-like DNA-binding protein